MKKLITMIGAAAMAFGLYADEPAVYDGTSFEAGEAGVSDDGKTWTASGLWSTTYEEPSFELGAYAGDAYNYGEYPRRDGMGSEDNVFPKGDTNDNYLKLSTGTNTLTRATDSKNYFDQVVKFTGFEEAQTNFVEGTKIAIWTSAFEPSGDFAGDTNLYVAVGTGNTEAPIKNVKIEVDPNFDFNAWHRVTIQNVDEVTDDNRVGFLVWIDGVMAEVDDDDLAYFEQNVIQYKKYYDAGQLFIAMQTGTAVSGVGFAGQGCIDDVAVTAVGPKFTDLSVDVTVKAITGANIVVKDAAGNEIPGVNNVYAIPAGAFTVTYTAAQGYKLAVDPVVKNYDTTTTKVNDSATVKPAVVVAYLNTNTPYAESELYDLLCVTGLKENDQLAFIKRCDVTNGVDNTSFYIVASNTTITAGKDAWAIVVNNCDGKAVDFTDNVGAADGFNKAFTFESEDGMLMLSADIGAGSEIVVNVGLAEATEDIEVAGTLKAATLTIDKTITLSGDGKVETMDDSLLESFLPAGKVEKVDGPETDWYTYQLKETPTTGFMIIIGQEEGETYDTLAEAIENAQEGATIKFLADYTYAAVPQMIYLTKDLTFDLNGTTFDTGVDAAGKTPKTFITIVNDKTLTVNGTDATMKARFTVGLGNGDISKVTGFTSKEGHLVINGGTYSVIGAQTVIHVNGEVLASSVSIKDATIESASDNGVQFNGKGTYTIENSSISGATAIYMKGGTLTIDENSTIAATAETYTAPVADRNGSNATGDAIVMDSNTSYSGAISLSVAEGATVTKNAEGAVLIRETITAGDTSTTVSIQPGDIDDIALTDSFAAKVAANQATLGGGFVAVANGKPYKTLAAAVTAAGIDGTVTLLANCDLGNELDIDKPITINLAGKTITTTAEIYFKAGAEGFSLTNGSIVSGLVERDATKCVINVIDTYGTIKDLTVNSANFEGGVTASTDGEEESMATPITGPLVCENVTVTGSRYLLYTERVNMELIDCTATQSGSITDSTPWRNCAVGAAWGATLTIKGGTYTAESDVIGMMSSVAKIVVEGGTFTGKVNEWPLAPASREAYGTHTWVIKGGDFSDNQIPLTYIEQKDGMRAKWAASAIDGYVTPAWDVVYTISTTGGENATVTLAPTDGKGIAGETVTITAEPDVDYTYEGVVLPDGWTLGEDGVITFVETISATKAITVPDAVEEATDITITLTKEAGIAKILVNDEEKDGEITLPKETTTVKIELVADATIKIPVYKNDDTVIGKVTPEFAVEDGKTYTFSAEEADEDDVTEDQAKQALKDAGVTDEKIAQLTAKGVTAKGAAAWVASHDLSVDALKGDYVAASVKLDTTAPITKGTSVQIDTLTKGEGTVLTFKVKVGADDVSTKAAITSMVKATDDLTTKAWELAADVEIEGETVKVTPPTGKTQAFVKVVIPADAPAAE